jgi:prepilin-type N-terminal cleavage/methylation domain-containing protein
VQVSMRCNFRADVPSRVSTRGFTLAEVAMSLMIVGLVFGGILTAYLQSAQRAEWSGHSLAAQAFGLQQLEQARSAVWDISATPPVNEITNLNLIDWRRTNGIWTGYSWGNLDVPSSGDNFVRATNFVTVREVVVTATPRVTVHSVHVDTVWEQRGARFTNSVATYYGPDL